jgi:hypothetical protein
VAKYRKRGGQMGFQKYLIESGFARARRMLMGDVPHIDTMGIMTAQNPRYKTVLEKPSNKDINKHLWDHLRTASYGPIKMKGKFEGFWEDSFLIPHIAKEEMEVLGRRYGQAVVIWGEKKVDDNNNPYFNFEWIEFDENGNAKITQTKPISVSSFEDIQNRPDMFSMIKGRKFTIPFWDDPYAKAVPGEKYGTIQFPDEDEIEALRKAESYIVPFFENPFYDAVPLENYPEPTYYSEKLPQDDETVELIETIQKNQQEIKELEGKNRWYARIKMHRALTQLVEHLI